MFKFKYVDQINIYIRIYTTRNGDNYFFISKFKHFQCQTCQLTWRYKVVMKSHQISFVVKLVRHFDTKAILMSSKLQLILNYTINTIAVDVIRYKKVLPVVKIFTKNKKSVINGKDLTQEMWITTSSLKLITLWVVML